MSITPRPSAVADTLPSGFDPTQFVGEVSADGQRVRVASLATDAEGRVAFLSIVGYETSVSAALARLLKGEQLGFLPTDDRLWRGPSALQSLNVSYWLWRADITGTREKQGVLFPRCASITHGLRNPPLVPVAPPHETSDPLADVQAILEQIRRREPDPSPLLPRILLGDISADAPVPAAFFGHLKGLRALVLPSLAWIDYLWVVGLNAGLITPLLSLGVNAWRLDGDPRRWNALISEGVISGDLPQTHPTAHDMQRLQLRH